MTPVRAVCSRAQTPNPVSSSIPVSISVVG